MFNNHTDVQVWHFFFIVQRSVKCIRKQPATIWEKWKLTQSCGNHNRDFFSNFYDKISVLNEIEKKVVEIPTILGEIGFLLWKIHFKFKKSKFSLCEIMGNQFHFIRESINTTQFTFWWQLCLDMLLLSNCRSESRMNSTQNVPLCG